MSPGLEKALRDVLAECPAGASMNDHRQGRRHHALDAEQAGGVRCLTIAEYFDAKTAPAPTLAQLRLDRENL